MSSRLVLHNCVGRPLSELREKGGSSALVWSCRHSGLLSSPRQPSLSATRFCYIGSSTTPTRTLLHASSQITLAGYCGSCQACRRDRRSCWGGPPRFQSSSRLTSCQRL